MKRGRNQRRRQGGNPNRALDSNGPDVRIRGTANQIHDKYQTLARDAQSAGDRVKAENYLQHAEHYFRLMKALQPTPQPQQDSAEQGGDQPSVSQDREERDNRDDRGRRPRHNNRDNNNRHNSQERSEPSESPRVEESAAEPVVEVAATVDEAIPAEKSEAEPVRKPTRKRRAPRTTKSAKAAKEKDEVATS